MLLAFAAVGVVAAPVAEPQPEAKADAAPADYGDYGDCKTAFLARRKITY